jgi:ribosomal protein L37AE/L43A
VTETRVAVFYCPFCAEEDLHPVEQHGGWECRSCLRVFAVKVLGLAPRVASLAGPTQPGRQR